MPPGAGFEPGARAPKAIVRYPRGHWLTLVGSEGRTGQWFPTPQATAVYCSQILMVPKPDGSRRLCVDYRPLNFCTPNPSWPLQDISQSFNRIGVQKPKKLV
jgi:hypothetical protein